MVKKKLITRRELAQNLNVVMGTVTKWEQSGMPCAEPGRKGKASLYSEREVRKWLTAREKNAQSNGVHDVARDRARKDRAQAVLAEQTAEIRARDLVPRVQVERVWAAEVAAVRAKVLAWPSTTSDKIYRESAVGGVKGVERVLKEAAEGLLRELAGTLPWNWPCPLCGSKKPSRKKKPTRAKKTTRKKKPRASGRRS